MLINVPDWGYYSHLPVLAAAIGNSQGPILELGCGDGSTFLTSLLHRKVITVDSNEEWINRYRNKKLNKTHDFILLKWLKDSPESSGVNEQISSWCDTVKELCLTELYFSVVFVDMAPGEARVPVIKLLKDNARWIVVHDRCADDPPGGGNYGWKQLDGLFKYEYRFTELRPHTAVYSNFEAFQ